MSEWNITAGPFKFGDHLYVRNGDDWYASSVDGNSWMLYEMPDVVAERDRLAAEVEALCAFVDAWDNAKEQGFSHDADTRLSWARAAIEPILAARRAERG